MDSFAFPFPLKLDFGLLRLEVERRCLVLKRTGREYPHVTLFYEPKPGRGYWWPHVTWRRGRHEELMKVWPRHGQELEQRFERIILPRLDTVFTPVNLEELSDSGWLVLIPSPEFLCAFVDFLLVGRNVLSFQKLEAVEDDPDGWARFVERIFAHFLDPLELENYRPSGPLFAFQFTDDGIADQRILYGYDLGLGVFSWFSTPYDIVGMSPKEFISAIAPKAFTILQRIAEVLDLPLSLAGQLP